MYTGIIQTLAKVQEVSDNQGLRSFKVKVDPSFLKGVYIGASCGIDGVCFTVTAIENDLLSFDAISQTLESTTIGSLEVGEEVHFERSLRYGEENGGHNISGHVHGVCVLEEVKSSPNNVELFLKLPKGWAKYIFEKGFVSLHGASLTVSSVNLHSEVFSVSLIPETLKQTKFSSFKVGDFINFEVEQQTKTLVDVVERTLKK